MELISFVVKPSKIHTRLTLAIGLVALGAIWLSGLNFYLLALLSIFLGHTTLAQLKRIGRTKQIDYEYDHWVMCEDGFRSQAQLLGKTCLTPWVIVLYLKSDVARWTISIWKDSLDDFSYRTLTACIKVTPLRLRLPQSD